MFDMTNDSDLFRTRQELENEGLVERNKVFEGPEARWLPIYEGKMISMWDHRAASIKLTDAPIAPAAAGPDLKGAAP